MADTELSRKLNRRLILSDESSEGNELVQDQNRLDPNLHAPVQRKISSSSSTGSEKAISDSATDELSKKLNRRQDINEGNLDDFKPMLRSFNPFTEFKEFSRKQIKEYENIFKS